MKPRQVVERVVRFYEHSCANIHRGNHTLSQEASQLFESARDAVAAFINATGREIVFTSNTTDSVHLVADGLGLEPGDNVVTSVLDHHSNLLPWLSRCEVRLLPEGDDGTVDMTHLAELVDERTRLVALSHASNVTGAVNQLEEGIELAHRRGALVLVDGAQAAPHVPVDVVSLGCDFYAFSGHKMLAPSGVGVLFIGERAWDRVGVAKVGGGTVLAVRRTGFDLKRVPYRFEAGTPNIEGVVGLGAAVEYLDRMDMAKVAAHDAELARVMHECFADLPGLRMLGPRDPRRKIAIASLAPTTKAFDVETLAMMLSDSHKVMARAGTHCAHPYFRERGLAGSLRLSAYVYTSAEEIRAAAAALRDVVRSLAVA